MNLSIRKWCHCHPLFILLSLGISFGKENHKFFALYVVIFLSIFGRRIFLRSKIVSLNLSTVKSQLIHSLFTDKFSFNELQANYVLHLYRR